MKKIIFLILLTVLSVNFDTSQAFVINQDTITINNIPKNDTAFVLIDGLNTEGKQNDRKFIVNNNSPNPIGDFIANNVSWPYNEVFVFSRGKKAVRKTKNWVGNQNLTVGLTNYKTVNIKFWIPPGNYSDTITWREMIQTYKARANELFHDFSFGIQITASFISRDSMATYQSLLSSGYTSCCSGLFEALKDNRFYTENIINVYLVGSIPDEGGGSRGYNCRENQNVIFLNKTNLTVETLAHEIGHAFSLGHSNFDEDTPRPGFTLSNIMNGNGAIRDTFHFGQAFHANFNDKSKFYNYFLPNTVANIARRNCFRPCSGDTNSYIKCPSQAFNF